MPGMGKCQLQFWSQLCLVTFVLQAIPLVQSLGSAFSVHSQDVYAEIAPLWTVATVKSGWQKPRYRKGPLPTWLNQYGIMGRKSPGWCTWDIARS